MKRLGQLVVWTVIIRRSKPEIGVVIDVKVDEDSGREPQYKILWSTGAWCWEEEKFIEDVVDES